MSTLHWWTRYIRIYIPAWWVASTRALLGNSCDSLSLRSMKIYFHHNDFVRIKSYANVKWSSGQRIQWYLVCCLLHPLKSSNDVIETVKIQTVLLLCVPTSPRKSLTKAKKILQRGWCTFLALWCQRKSISTIPNLEQIWVIYNTCVALQSILFKVLWMTWDQRNEY